MRIAIAVLFVVLTGSAFDTARADPYRWCAVYGFRGNQGTNCYFVTLRQCEETISGIGGHCERNPFYDGRPVRTPEDGPPPRRRSRPR